MDKIRIAIIDHVGIRAGMECYDLGLGIALKEAGCEPVIYSNFTTSSATVEVRQFFNFRIRWSIFSALGLLKKYLKLAGELKAAKNSHVILHGFRFGPVEWMLMLILKRSTARILLIVHDLESLTGDDKSGKWRKRIFEMCRHLIVHNKYCYERLAVVLDESQKKKLVVIEHGNFIGLVEHFTNSNNFFSGLQSEEKKLLFFGQIKESKGLDLLLEAFGRTDKGTELIIAGRMRKHSFQKYQKLINENGLESRVRLMIGYVSPDLRDSLFREADAVVLPYRKVFQSGVMLMAMSYRKAVIASDLPPNKEVISNDKNGMLFTSGSTSELAVAINTLMKNDVLRESIAEEGFQTVSKKYNWKGIAAEWLKLLK
jgi:D-inositol-3-phosphate glycosyltransferase